MTSVKPSTMWAVEVYDNFLTAPLDDPPLWEGDDSPSPRKRASLVLPPEGLLAAAPTAVLVVPFRPCEPGDTNSNAVYALKRANARFRQGGRLTALESKLLAVRKTWSKDRSASSFYADFKETRRLLGLGGAVVHDEASWRKLAPWFDSKALSLLAAPKLTRIDKQIAWHMSLYNRRGRVAYSQARPSQLGRPEIITRADCSGSIAAGCNWAGILPQVDWRWTNTDVQIRFGIPVPSISAAKRGDVILYGSGGDPSHEALYLGNGRVWSFGSYPIRLLEDDYRPDRIAIRRFVP